MEPLIKEDRLPNFSKLIKMEHIASFFRVGHFLPAGHLLLQEKLSRTARYMDFTLPQKEEPHISGIFFGDFDIPVGVVNWLMATPEKLNGFMYVWHWFAKEKGIFYPRAIETEVREAVDIVDVPSFSAVKSYEFCEALDKNIKRLF